MIVLSRTFPVLRAALHGTTQGHHGDGTFYVFRRCGTPWWGHPT